MVDMSQVEAPNQELTHERYLWREQYPTQPLTEAEQTRFAGLVWISPAIRRMEYPDPEFGVRQVNFGDPTHVTIVTQEEDGSLIKRVVPEEPIEIAYLSARGPVVPERTIYSDDSFVEYGPVNNDTLSRRIFFQKGIEVNGEVIHRAMGLAEDFQVTIQQDFTSRRIKQAERDLLDSLGIVAQDPNVAKALREKLGDKLQEAAIEVGLIQASRTSLPDKVRLLADMIEKAGIKCIELRGDQEAYWPDGIRESWDPETDDWTWKEWTDEANPRQLRSRSERVTNP